MRSTKSVQPSETQETRKQEAPALQRAKTPRTQSTLQPTDQSTKELTKHIPMEGTKQRSIEVTNERTKIRHTFDILADQLLSLREIALAREKQVKKRILIGDLVQEALDIFITKERNKE